MIFPAPAGTRDLGVTLDPSQALQRLAESPSAANLGDEAREVKKAKGKRGGATFDYVDCLFPLAFRLFPTLGPSPIP